MASRLLEGDPELAYRHAMAAQARGGRVGVVREAAGIAAYAAGHYDEALAELRAARRITGDSSYWPVMADCERGLGRPERALSMAGSAEVSRLDRAAQIEMRIVAAGARRDLGQHDAAVVTLQGPELQSAKRAPWTIRLWYAYADALLAAGRDDEAEDWFGRVASLDDAGETDAADRLAEIQGIGFLDEWEGPDQADGSSAESPQDVAEVASAGDEPEMDDRHAAEDVSAGDDLGEPAGSPPGVRGRSPSESTPPEHAPAGDTAAPSSREPEAAASELSSPVALPQVVFTEPPPVEPQDDDRLF